MPFVCLADVQVTLTSLAMSRFTRLKSTVPLFCSSTSVPLLGSAELSNGSVFTRLNLSVRLLGDGSVSSADSACLCVARLVLVMALFYSVACVLFVLSSSVAEVA